MSARRMASAAFAALLIGAGSAAARADDGKIPAPKPDGAALTTLTGTAGDENQTPKIVDKGGNEGSGTTGKSGDEFKTLQRAEILLRQAENAGRGGASDVGGLFSLIDSIETARVRELYHGRLMEAIKRMRGSVEGGGGYDPANPTSAVLKEWNRRNKERRQGDPKGWTDSAELGCLEGNFRDCYFDSNRAIELGAGDAKTYALHGAAANNLGDYTLAFSAASKALELDPNNAAAKAVSRLSQDRVGTVSLPSAMAGGSSAEAAAAIGGAPAGGAGAVLAAGSSPGASPAQIAEAAGRHATAAMSGAERSAVLTKQAASALGLQDYVRARDTASQAIAINQQNAQAWNYRAIAHNKLGRFNDAVYDASFALALAPGNTPALQSRSWAFNKMRKYREGLADANSTLEREPENPFAYQNRAFALAGLKDREGMLASLQRSAAIDPRFRERAEAALQAPEESDLLFLFDDAPAAQAGAPAARPAPTRRKRFMSLVVLAVSGGGLVALGLLHVFSSSFRETLRSTARRLSPRASESGTRPLGVWGQYELVRELGIGGMGVVYQARDTSLDRPVAIKKMRDEIRLDRRERERFVQEAKTVASLHHPNIVDIYSIVEEDGEVYLIFEYAEGKPLSAVLQEKGVLQFAAAARLIRDACGAVDYAHRNRVIHRDIKPSNIMVMTDGSAKVMDFGVARQAKEAATRLMTNTVVGTPPYMAPEQEQGNVRPESDVYALGICFYEMLCGKLPFQGQGAGMLLNKLNGRFVPVSQQVNGGVPPGLDAVIAKALAPDPDRRFRTAAELRAAVESLGSGGGA